MIINAGGGSGGGTPGPTGNGIDYTELTDDYMLALHYTNGETDTVGPVRGPQGATGPQGPQGNPGAAVITSGYWGMSVNANGHLILTYEDTVPPDLEINSSGHLILTLDI